MIRNSKRLRRPRPSPQNRQPLSAAARIASALAALLAFTAPALALSPRPRPLLVSQSSGPHGTRAPAASFRAISADGRRVLFSSGRGQGFPGGGLFLRRINSAHTSRIAPTSGDVALADDTLVYVGRGLQLSRRGVPFHQVAPEGSSQPSLSASGRQLVFTSSASSLTDGGERQVFSRYVPLAGFRFLSRANGRSSARADGESFDPVISNDGHYVAFTSQAHNLIPAHPLSGYVSGVYLRNLKAGTTIRISPGSALAAEPSITADGSRVAFIADGSVLQYERSRGSTREVDRGGRYTPRSGPEISADGRYLAYRIATGDPDLEDLAVTDLRTGHTARIARIGRTQAGSGPIGITPDGRSIGFDTYGAGDVGNKEGFAESGQAYRIRNPLFHRR